MVCSIIPVLSGTQRVLETPTYVSNADWNQDSPAAVERAIQCLPYFLVASYGGSTDSHSPLEVLSRCVTTTSSQLQYFFSNNSIFVQCSNSVLIQHFTNLTTRKPNTQPAPLIDIYFELKICSNSSETNVKS